MGVTPMAGRRGRGFRGRFAVRGRRGRDRRRTFGTPPIEFGLQFFHRHTQPIHLGVEGIAFLGDPVQTLPQLQRLRGQALDAKS
jgi:hypothetical protein